MSNGHLHGLYLVHELISVVILLLHIRGIDLFCSMPQNPNVDMDNDWKLLNFFIGGNDLCLG